MRTQVFSYGGGVQSVAIAILILQGRLPRPDYIVISDTGYERSSTWRYMEAYTFPALAEIGLDIVRIDRRDWEKSDVIQEYQGKHYIAVPFYNSGGGKVPGMCSNKWKKYVIRRWLKSIGVNQCDIWLGFTTDEMRRIRVSDVNWARNVYPLMGGLFDGPANLVFSRQDCLSVIHAHGWPIPQKSSCYICPHMRDSEWESLPRNELLFAADIEQRIRSVPEGCGVYLHRSCRPLLQVDFNARDTTGDMLGCDSGFCFF
jgi:predicted DNA-binding transcriptional regulator AlpA